MTLLIAAGMLYAVGSYRIHATGGRVRRVERASFWIGWSVLVASVAPWMDRIVQVSFSAHMAQHEMMMRIGAPLVIVGRPIVPWIWALPTAMRRSTGGALALDAPRAIWKWLTTPVVAWALHGVTVWLWHLPKLYEAAVNNEALHTAEHAMFVGTAVVFWWGLVYGRYGRAAYGMAALYVFTTMLYTGVLGALFALSTSPFYAIYRDRAPAAGLDAVHDQQLAGLYMWIPAGVVLTTFGLALVLAWLSESDRRSRIDTKIV